MIRRNQRMRREYLYTKSLEGTERALFEKKRRIRQALEEGKPIPTELRNEEHELRRQIDLEDQERQGELFLSLHSTPFLIEQVECVVPVRLFAGRFAIFCVWLANDVFLRCDFVIRCRSFEELR